ncbi:MAG: hypothetical protein IJE89_05685 [Bacilli bacterium]|nr:hypothetical protein [Bacilli bacterium]
MNDKNKRIITILSIFTIIFTLMGGTLAYWVWDSTTNTGLAFTITKDFSCYADGGEGISNEIVELIPIYEKNCATSPHVLKRTITLSADIERNDMTLGMDIWLKVNSIDPTLANNKNLRYAISSSSISGCIATEEGYIASGNFAELTTGSQALLLNNVEFIKTDLTPKTYYLYIWLDSEETNNETQDATFDLSLGGECTETTPETLSNKIISLAELGSNNVYREITSASVDYEIIPANSTYWNTMNIGSGTVIEDELDGWFSVNVLCYEVGELWKCGSGEMTLIPKEAGYYRVVLESDDYFETIIINGRNIYYYDPVLGSGAGSTTFYLTPEDTIELSFSGCEVTTGATYGKFRIEKSKKTGLHTYRYEGKDVDNYIIFNDEMWRIIGLEHGSVIGLETGKYYPKIIRSEFLSNSVSYGGDDIITDWEFSHINGGLYAYYRSSSSGVIDYSTEGISDESRMLIEHPTWEGLGLSNISNTKDTYINESSKFDKSNFYRNYVGLLSPSDYGFAASQKICGDTLLTSYSSCINNNWLYSGKKEWLISDSEAYQALIINEAGDITVYNTLSYLSIRPVVYLNPDVLITGGTGKIDDPYKIELKES